MFRGGRTLSLFLAKSKPKYWNLVSGSEWSFVRQVRETAFHVTSLLLMIISRIGKKVGSKPWPMSFQLYDRKNASTFGLFGISNLLLKLAVSELVVKAERARSSDAVTDAFTTIHNPHLTRLPGHHLGRERT